jgi:DNA-binding HxlR family transcriptional regulator/putative sterol carrier protein
LAPDDVVFGVAESAQMEAIISELEAMTRRSYGQFCGVSRALEAVGERWALLIIRDLLVEPKNIVDLQAGLPRIPTDILATRLRDFERVGVVRRQSAEAGEPAVYELTEYGQQLDEIILQLGRWGAQMLGNPRPEEIVTTDSMIMALRTVFHPAPAQGVRVAYELRIGDVVLHAQVDDGEVRVAAGPFPGADLILEPGKFLHGLLTGEVDPDRAIADGMVEVAGDTALLRLFTEIFHIDGEHQV